MPGSPPSRRPALLLALAGLALLALLMLGIAETVPGPSGRRGAGDAVPPLLGHAPPPPGAEAPRVPTGTPPPEAATGPEAGTGPEAPPGVGGGPEPDPHSGRNLQRRIDPVLMQRLLDAVRLGQAARDGDAQAAEEARTRRAAEPDPRVRHALATGEVPPLGEALRRAPVLPPAAQAAQPGRIDAYWLTPGHPGTYQSRIDIDADGRARVETVVEGDPRGRWQVRYEAWAWRDAKGNLVVDSRGQDVDVIACPPNCWWSPDSMVIAPGGTVELIDDKFDPGQGTLGSKGAG